MHYVYLLVSENGEHYIGYTKNLRRRIKEHTEGKSRYTKGKKWKVVYYEAYLSKEDAVQRERRLKNDGRARYGLMRRVQRSLREVL